MAIRVRTLVAAALIAAGFSQPAVAQEGDPLPRVEGAFCPGIAGLPQDFAEMVVYRIRENAASLDRTLADPGTCRPNLIVAVVPDGQAYLRQLNKEDSNTLSDLPMGERRALLEDSGPVHVVSRVVTRSRDGHPLAIRENLNDIPQLSAWMSHSKIYSTVRRDIVYTLVLLNSDAIRGMTVAQLADYVTMRALMYRTPRSAKVDAGSVLTLFDAPAEARPAGMTAGDRAILAALYEGIPNLPATARLAELEKSASRRSAE